MELAGLAEEFLSLFQADFYKQVGYYIFVTWPLWLPVVLSAIALDNWLSFKRRQWVLEQGSVLLEIKLPREIEKSPAAMEQIINHLFEPVVGNIGDVYLKGRVRDWFSLEIVSIGGQVKFYIWAFKKWKNNIESRIYAHYPNVEVHEADDYARAVEFDPGKMPIWGATTTLVKAAPYPIKTYVDYELDKQTKEQEQLTDPIVSLIEYIGSIGPDEQIWVQILIRAHRKEGLLDGRIVPKPDWTDSVKEEIKKVIEKDAFIKGSEERGPSLQNSTDTQKKTITAIERKASKLPFDTMIRMLYTAPEPNFDKGRIGGILGSFRNFGSQNMNGIKPDQMTGIEFPWKDFRDRKKTRNQKLMLDAYKKRSFFTVPYKHLNGKSYVLSAEEIATIFHFPGSVASTPTLARVPSKKAEAPANLPV